MYIDQNEESKKAPRESAEVEEILVYETGEGRYQMTFEGDENDVASFSAAG